MTRIEYLPGFPDEIRTALHPILEKWLWLLPTWCHELRVEYDTQSPNCLEITTDFEYRNTHLTVCPKWLGYEAQYRDHSVAHEFVHVIYEPMMTVFNGILHTLLPDESLRKLMEEQWRIAVEGATEDLSSALSSR